MHYRRIYYCTFIVTFRLELEETLPAFLASVTTLVRLELVGPWRRRIQVQIFSCTWQLGFSGFIFFLDKKRPFPTSLTPYSRGAPCQSEYTSSEAVFPISTDSSSYTELMTLVTSLNVSVPLPITCWDPNTPCDGIIWRQGLWETTHHRLPMNGMSVLL